jgi:hypothetical protein
LTSPGALPRLCLVVCRAARVLFALIAAASAAHAQIRLEGRALAERSPGSKEIVPLTGVVVFASLAGAGSESLSFRTWEMEPAGWFRLSGSAGRYTLSFSTPAHFARPVVLTNIFTRDAEVLTGFRVEPRFDYAEFGESAWDLEPASRYIQVFTAKGTSVTNVGFKLATDGVDGVGPGSQGVVVTVRRKGAGTPDTWEQVGPDGHVLDVDCGGPKSYWYSCGWASGEVPTKPGETYAVEVRPEDRSRSFQAFWRESKAGEEDCFRVTSEGGSFVGRRIWLAVASDGDGITVAYPKRVHAQFRQLTRMGSKWTQTYRARGRSIASVALYAAVSGAQPPLSRQRARIRVRRGGPDGPVVGIEKVAAGNGNYTGDASWGFFGAAFAPGEVQLEPGEVYAIELESMETYHTVHGFVNIKGQVSDDRPGFNPYRKSPPDACVDGTAYYLGTEPVDFDLDMQVLEYEHAAECWQDAVGGPNRLANGDMESGDLRVGDPVASRVDSWRPFDLEPGTAHHYLVDPAPPSASGTPNRIVRVAADAARGKVADGGFVERAADLSSLETYRVSGLVRSTWPLDVEHQCFVGLDETGQVDDPRAKTIIWTPLPPVHGAFVQFASEPVRPRSTAISVWLRARATKHDEKFPFQGDFDGFALRRVRTEAPN